MLGMEADLQPGWQDIQQGPLCQETWGSLCQGWRRRLGHVVRLREVGD